MFALRGLAVSLSIFVAVYWGLSLLVCLAWRKARALAAGRPAPGLARFLFGVRLFPLAAALLVTIVLAVPSFLLLEPRAIVEPIGGVSLFLGLCGLIVLTVGVAKTLLGILRVRRTISRWTGGAEPVLCPESVPVLRAASAAPPLTAVGIIRPRILLSGAAEFLLSANEFQSALNHEIAHVRRRDNLKKLLLGFVPFPGMRDLEEAWREATEMAADDAAVSSIGEALDLAAALIKLCRLGATESCGELGMSLVHSPVSLVNERVERLIHWSAQSRPERRHPRVYTSGLGLALLAVVGLSYGQLLIAVHAASEWLVR